MAGFFYDGENCNRHFTSVTDVRHPSLEFLPFNPDNIAILDCYNGLILCWCLGADGHRYVVCNYPMTKKYEILPPSTWNSGSGSLQMCEMLIIFCDDFELFFMMFLNHFCDEMNVLPVDEPGQAHMIK